MLFRSDLSRRLHKLRLNLHSRHVQQWLGSMRELPLGQVPAYIGRSELYVVLSRQVHASRGVEKLHRLRDGQVPSLDGCIKLIKLHVLRALERGVRRVRKLQHMRRWNVLCWCCNVRSLLSEFVRSTTRNN